MSDQIAREVSRRAEVKMLEHNISFIEALVSLFKKNPDLLKAWIQEISGE